MKINFLDKNAGFTMIELVMAITLMSIAMLGTLLAINTATLLSADPLITTQAIAIAESYLAEILGKNFESSTIPAAATVCPSTTLTRQDFKDICHYHGLNEEPTDQNGKAMPALRAYTVQVAIDRERAVLGTLAPGTEVIRIDVAVSHALMTGMTFSVYRTNY